jgi:arsenate reductase (thioredoxin)
MAAKKRILFVCLGNACRSAMAEKICNTYGQGLITADSAGIHAALPHINTDRSTAEVMEEVGINFSGHKPKHVYTVKPGSFDVLVNMSPMSGALITKIYFPGFRGKIIEWQDIRDPRNEDISVYRLTREILICRVKKLINELAGTIVGEEKWTSIKE